MPVKDALIRIGVVGVEATKKAFQSVADATSVVNKKLAITQKNLDKISRSLDRQGRTLSQSITLPLGLIAAGFAKATLEVESFTKQLETASKGTTKLEDLQKIAVLPGLDTSTLTKAQAQLEILGIRAQDATALMVNLANAIALEGKGPEDLEGITRAISQIIGKNKIQAEEINQLAERTAFIRTILFKQFGTAEGQDITRQLNAQGQGIKTFLANLAVGFSRLERAPDTLRNQLVNLKDSLVVTAGSIGLNIVQLFKIREIINFVANQIREFGEHWKTLDDQTKKNIVTFTAIAAAIGPVILAVSTLVKLTSVLIGLFTSTTAIISGIIIGFGALLVGLVKVINGYKTWGEAAERTARATFGFFKFLIDSIYEAVRGLGVLAAAFKTLILTGSIEDAATVVVGANIKSLSTLFDESTKAAENLDFSAFSELNKILNTDIEGVNKLSKEFQNLSLDQFDLQNDIPLTIPPSIFDKTEQNKLKKLREERAKDLRRGLFNLPRGKSIAEQITGDVPILEQSMRQLSDIVVEGLANVPGFSKEKLDAARAGIIGYGEDIAKLGQQQENWKRILENQNAEFEKQQEHLQSISDFVSDNLSTAFEGFFDILINRGENAFQAVVNVLKKLIVQMAKAVAAAAVLTALFSLLGGLNIIKGGLTGVKELLGFAGDKSLFKGFLGNLLPFAEGGIITGPTPALLGEAGKEVVLPLDQLPRFMPSQTIELVGEFILRGGDLVYLINRILTDRERIK